MEQQKEPKPYMNPYLAGFGLGLVLLAAFTVAGRGLGASGAITRFTVYAIDKLDIAIHGGTKKAETTIARDNLYMKKYVNKTTDPLDNFLVYMFIGTVAGGFVSGVGSRRGKIEVLKGPHTTINRRLFFAFAGGLIAALGARLARGCTSGQALTGGASLALGSWLFMIAIFAGGYAIAYFLRREWT